MKKNLEYLIARLKCRLLSLFILNKNKRRAFKTRFWERYLQNLASETKWGVSYSVYDGEELLEASIRSIRASVDYINVVYQKISWYGEPADENLVPVLQRLREEKIIDELIEFEPDLRKKPGKNETRKRNIGLAAARRAGCDYFMTMDADEFYRRDEMERAKDLILERRITHSIVAQTVYGRKPTEMLLCDGCCCQFFSRLTPFSRCTNNPRTIALVDPTRQLSHIPFWFGGSRYYFLHMVRMNHYSYLRKDVDKKFRNSSCQQCKEEKDSKIASFTALTCPDFFCLSEIADKLNTKQMLEK
ncbi:MAG: hypothetical protein ACI4PZ_03880 [Akkermansia sp.]